MELIFTPTLLALLICLVFFSVSKAQEWDFNLSSSFECGFTSYYFSRHSFSIHFFKISLIFLLLDLELCMFFPFLLDKTSHTSTQIFLFTFFVTLLAGLSIEWAEGKLEWVA